VTTLDVPPHLPRGPSCGGPCRPSPSGCLRLARARAGRPRPSTPRRPSWSTRGDGRCLRARDAEALDADRRDPRARRWCGRGGALRSGEGRPYGPCVAERSGRASRPTSSPVRSGRTTPRSRRTPSGAPSRSSTAESSRGSFSASWCASTTPSRPGPRRVFGTTTCATRDAVYWLEKKGREGGARRRTERSRAPRDRGRSRPLLRRIARLRDRRRRGSAVGRGAVGRGARRPSCRSSATRTSPTKSVTTPSSRRRRGSRVLRIGAEGRARDQVAPRTEARGRAQARRRRGSRPGRRRRHDPLPCHHARARRLRRGRGCLCAPDAPRVSLLDERSRGAPRPCHGEGHT
jgi:hypothetical protein